MLVVKPKVELWLQGNGLSSFVAQCARICYASDISKTLTKSIIEDANCEVHIAKMGTNTSLQIK